MHLTTFILTIIEHTTRCIIRNTNSDTTYMCKRALLNTTRNVDVRFAFHRNYTLAFSSRVCVLVHWPRIVLFIELPRFVTDAKIKCAEIEPETPVFFFFFHFFLYRWHVFDVGCIVSCSRNEMQKRLKNNSSICFHPLHS